MSDDRPDPVESTRFEEAFAQGLRDRPRPPSGPCPDAEVLAAFSEDSLSATDRQEVELHLATCMSCQAHVAALIRTEGIEPDTQPTTSWWLDWRWLAPLATTSVVLLAVWAVDPASVGDSGVEMEKTAPAPLDSGAGNELREASNAGSELRELSDAGDELREVSDAVRQERASDDERTALVLSRDQASPTETDSALVLEEVAAPALQTRQVAGDPSPAPADTALADASPPAAAAERRLDNLARLSSTASPLRNRAITREAGYVTVVFDETAAWRATGEGGLEHSSDGGVTWTRQLASTGAELTAGSATSSSVCWLVGRAGTILRTIDGGASWNRIDAPLQSDIVGVTATDGQTVVVEFSDGQAFVSADGGSTWTLPN